MSDFPPLRLPQNFFYFGTIERSGHSWYLNDAGEKLILRDPSHYFPKPYPKWFWFLDGTYAPYWTTEEGVAAVHVLHEATILAFHDYSIDSRPGSNGAFIAFEIRTNFEGIMKLFEAQFPKVFQRINAKAPLKYINVTHAP